ncbi:hypothetical protein FEM48_Zijuj10G0041000 [Ziziphus jujuba var. spinosa]|uniref:BAHD acyltransferase BIA1-like n=1 Tax=Ziziphus jujuba var. spinosa TaxID=714518 RepID=A0A978UL71_ZIZJJ|nr:hypothetical protein FEM48_Zijuj10G0041000 [Ziziphus jujuba var. spinosa]
MKVEIIKTEIIKPSSPTPPHLKTFKLCLMDQLAPVVYGSLVFFYQAKNNITVQQTSQHLKKSLSETLTRFYPLAGTIKGNSIVECNDDGAHFIQARVHGLLSTYLQKPNSELLHRLLPMEVESPKAATGPILLIQANFFDCGGFAIAIFFSHKLADASTVGIFLKGWSATALGHGDKVVPVFNAASEFPPREFSTQRPAVVLEKAKPVAKRFVFDGSKMAMLKSKAASLSVPQPTRVEAVFAVIWRSIIAAWKSNSGVSKHSVLTQSVNIRKRIDPPLEENCTGNLVGYLAAKTEKESETEVRNLVAQIRKSKKEFAENQVKIFRDKNAFEMLCEYFKAAGEMIRRDDINFLITTSLCNLGLYETDFGLGKPLWVSIPTGSSKNIVALIDTSGGGGGIEAWVCLSEEDMAVFERDPELLGFATPNPSVLDPVKWRSAL